MVGFKRRPETKHFSGSIVEAVGDFVEVFLGVDAQVDPLGQILADEAIRVFVGGALPWAVVSQRYQQQEASASITLNVENAYPGLDIDQGADVVAWTKALTRKNHTTKVAFGTEAGFFDGLGIPTVVCGPGSMEGQGHKADEYIEESELAECDNMLGRMLDAMS